MHASWDDGAENWGEGLGRMQSAACSPVVHLQYCSGLQSDCGLSCSPRLVLHVPWFDLAARLLRVLGLGIE